jgi:hypothetical protein
MQYSLINFDKGIYKIRYVYLSLNLIFDQSLR